jgi:hypothetical protein
VTGAEFSGVDFDLLADYVGGALDGTPDEAVVTALIADDDAWREAHAQLSGGVTAVTGQLRAWGSVAEPMPAEVFARIDAALLDAAPLDAFSGGSAPIDAAGVRSHAAPSDARVGQADLAPTIDDASIGRVAAASTADGAPAGPVGSESDADGHRDELAGAGRTGGRAAGVDGAAGSPAEMEPGSDGAAPARHLVAVPSGSRGKRARRLRWAAPVGIAAGVLAFVGFGVQQQFAGGASDDSASSTAAGAGQAAPQAAAGAAELSVPGGSVPLSESGRNFDADTLGQAANSVMVAPDMPDEQQGDFRKALPSPGKASAKDPALDRLRVQEALRACIEAIAAQHGAGEITPQTVDFARFDGSPAVIVQFVAAGDSWVWASGPACGTPGVGADKLASVKVG